MIADKRLRAWGWAACAAVCMAVQAALPGKGPETAPLVPGGLRIAVSENVAGEVNGNDLRAALRTWADAVAHQTGVRIEPEMCTTPQLIQRIKNRQVDAFSLNILEFEHVAAYADRELVMDSRQEPIGDEYVLLVHRAGGIGKVADLRGRSLLIYRHPRTCLGRMWLDLLLAGERLGPADTVLSRLEATPKLSGAVLPVFFRQADACVVTKHGFETLCELNPQLAAQLKPLASSPGLITAFLVFHKDSPPATRMHFLNAITSLDKTIEGQQALMLFGGTHLVRADISVLRSALDLMHAYEKLRGKPPSFGQ